MSPDLVKARAVVNDPKRVRALLEKKVRAGKGSREEAGLVADACVTLRDRACVDAVRAKYADL